MALDDCLFDFGMFSSFWRILEIFDDLSWCLKQTRVIFRTKLESETSREHKESETKTRESGTKIRESETKIQRIRNQKPRESETKIQESDTKPRESETENILFNIVFRGVAGLIPSEDKLAIISH